MEQLIEEVRAFAEQKGIKPDTVLQNAAGLSGNRWKQWLKGASCRLDTAEKIRRYMAEAREAA